MGLRGAIHLLRTGVGERLRGTRLDVLPVVSGDGSGEVWIADADTSEVFARIPQGHVPILIEELGTAWRMLESKPPEDEWYGQYPPAGTKPPE